MAKGGKGKNNNTTVTTGSGEDDTIQGPGSENKINGGGGNDLITGGDGSDRVNAGGGDDTVTGGLGDDTLYGNGGFDTAIFSGDVRNYAFSDGKGNSFIVDGDDGTDTLKHFEALQFDNFTVYLDGRNNGPLVDDAALTISEDDNGSVDLLAGSWDFEGDNITVTSVDGGTLNGSTLTFDASGDYDYLAVGESTTKDITFTASDGTTEVTRTATITIEGVNDATVTADDAGTAGEDGSASGNVLTNDSDVDASDVLSVANPGMTALTYADVMINADGSWTATPNAAAQALDDGDSVTESITIEVSDGHATVTSILEITLTGSNDAPLVTGDAGSTDEDNSTSGNVLTNDDDVDANDVLTVANSGMTALTYADVMVNADGSWTATPNATAQSLAEGESVTESITVEVTDGTETVTSTLEIEVTGANDSPSVSGGLITGSVTEAENNSADENNNANHNANGTVTFDDVDASDSHTAAVEAEATGYLGSFSASITDAGTVDWNFDVADADLDSMDAGDVLTQTYTVTIGDGNGAVVSESVTVTINGAADNTAPFITSGDTASVTAVAGGSETASTNLFSVEQYTGYASTSLANLQTYASNHTANYTVETAVIDYTDDPAGFGGEIEGSSPWPAAAATGATGAGGVNNSFFARITTDFTTTETDTYTFRTYNDDGVFLMVDGVLVINDSGIHPEKAFEGTITLDPGAHTIELFFFEYGGEASLELSVRTPGGAYSLVGDVNGPLGGAALTDSGSLTFGDIDLLDTHTLSVVDGASDYLGTFNAAIPNSSTGDGDGRIAWNFAVDNSNEDVVALAVGDVITQTYDVTVTDNSGASATETVTVTINGTNDAPTVTGGIITGEITEAANNSDDENNNATHNASGTVTFGDVDVSDTHTASSTANGSGYLGDFTASVTAAGIVVWSFDASDADVDFLEVNQSITQSYDVTLDDGNGGTVSETVTITINGAADNTAPVAVTDVFAPNALLEDTSFEAHYTPLHTDNPTDSAWTFVGSGVTTYAPTTNEFSFTDGTSYAPEGNQVAFLQYWSGRTTEAAISQTVTAYAGEYTLEFDAASRANYGANTPAFEVRIDGVVVATVEETSTNYMHHSITFDIPTNGEHTISLVAVPSSADDGDDTTLLDNIVLTVISTDFSDTVATNDSDADAGAVLTYTLDAPVAGLTMNADGSYTVEQADAAYAYLGEGETLEVEANYTVTDDQGATDQATLTFTVTDAGRDAHYGSAGADVFVFDDNTGNDYIYDYEDGLDVLDMSAVTGIDDFSDLTITQSGANTLIDLGNGETLLLVNTTATVFDAGDFIF